MTNILLSIIILLLFSVIALLAYPIHNLIEKNYKVNKDLAEWFKRSEITAGLEFDGKNFALKTKDEVEKEEAGRVE